MLEVKNVNFAQLKEACTSINDSGLVEELKLTPIKTIGVKKEAIVAAFTLAVQTVMDEDRDDDLSDEVIDLYILIDPNDEYGDEDEEDTKQDKKKPAKTKTKKEPKVDAKPKTSKKKGASKKEVPKKDVKKDVKKDAKKDAPKKEEPKKETKKRTHERSSSEYSAYGHRLTTSTGQLDVTLVDGATIKEMTKLYHVDPSYIRRHFRRLKKKGFVLTEKETDNGIEFKLQPINKK